MITESIHFILIGSDNYKIKKGYNFLCSLRAAKIQNSKFDTILNHSNMKGSLPRSCVTSKPPMYRGLFILSMMLMDFFIHYAAF